MSTPAQRAALAALQSARPTVDRLNLARHPDDVAADVIETWSAVETALRSLLGGSSLGGLALVRELSGRQQLTLAQANALAEFSAARDRAAQTPYTPTQTDVDAARNGFNALYNGLAAEVNAGVPGAPVASVAAASTPVMPAPAAAGPARRRNLLPAIIGALALAALVTVAALYWVSRDGAGSTVAEGARLYQEGRREAARAKFAEALRDDPTQAAPHIYLSRIARDEGDLATARNELLQAVRLEPDNATAQREMGNLLFLTGSYDLARNFYVRAIQRNPNDRAAIGYLGCTLVRLGRAAEAQNFLQRAGAGAWSACAQQAPAVPPPGP